MSRQLVKKSQHYSYLLYLPVDYSPNKQYPLMIFLHGSGERGHDPEIVKRNGPPLIVETIDLPFIIVSPQCPLGESWNPEYLKIILDEVLSESAADIKRIYLTGISMGGYGTWDFAMAYPEYFAAIIPICGGGNPNYVDKLMDIPTWVFHGAKDRIVPVSESIVMVEALKKANPQVLFTIYPDLDHDSWTITYQNQELYTWLLNQMKS